MSGRAHDVAVYVAGAFRWRVLIDDIDGAGLPDAAAVERLAREMAQQAIKALAATPSAQWRARIVATREIEDATLAHQP